MISHIIHPLSLVTTKTRFGSASTSGGINSPNSCFWKNGLHIRIMRKSQVFAGISVVISIVKLWSNSDFTMIWRANTPSFHREFHLQNESMRQQFHNSRGFISIMPWPHLQNMAVEIATWKEPLVDGERTSSWPPKQSETHLLILSPFPLKSPFWKKTSQTQALSSHIYII